VEELIELAGRVSNFGRIRRVRRYENQSDKSDGSDESDCSRGPSHLRAAAESLWLASWF
jgi:hypothetical protein